MKRRQVLLLAGKVGLVILAVTLHFVMGGAH
jgi:hypothetical protein